jgi:uncharacterized protein (DUF2147 family)
MPKLLVPLAAIAMMWAAVLAADRAEATAVSAAASSIRATAGNTSAVEEARCWRRRVCGPRGCAWRTTCRRWW